MRKKIFIGTCLLLSVGYTMALASWHDIPGVTRPYDPPNYYSETSVSYADSPSPFAMMDLARNGFQVKDVTRGIKNALSDIKTYAQALVTEQLVQNKIKNMTGLPQSTTVKTQENIKSILAQTEKINKSNTIEDVDTQTLFRTSQTVGDPTLSFSGDNQKKYLNNVYLNMTDAAKLNMEDADERAAAIQEILNNSNNAEGKLAAKEANTQIIALYAAEIARRNALLSNYAALEGVHERAEHDQQLQAAQVAKNAFTFRVADPYNPENTDKKAYTKPQGNGFVNF